MIQASFQILIEVIQPILTEKKVEIQVESTFSIFFRFFRITRNPIHETKFFINGLSCSEKEPLTQTVTAETKTVMVSFDFACRVKSKPTKLVGLLDRYDSDASKKVTDFSI